MTRMIAATAETWLEAYRIANQLAREGAGPRWLTTAIGGAKPGDILLPESMAEPPGAEIRPIRVGLYGNGGAPYNHASVFAEAGFLTEFVFASDILRGALTDIDVLVMPGGGCRAMMGQLDPLGATGCRAIADFVRTGGMYLGCCAGAFDASIVGEAFLAICPQQSELSMIDARVWNDGDDFLGLQSPGVGVIRARLAAPDHPVCLGMPEEFEISHYNGPLYDLDPGHVPDASDVTGLMSVAGTTDGFTPSERFLGADTPDGDLLVTEAAHVGAFNAVAGRFGEGRVVLFGSHPEFGLSLALEKYGAPARMLANAAFWQATAPGPHRATRAPAGDSAAAGDVSAGLETLMARIPDTVDKANALLSRDTAEAGWLQESLAMSTFGVTGSEVWAQNLTGFRPMAEQINSIAADLRKRAADPGTEQARLAALAAALYLCVPAKWNNDVGYEGALQQLDRVERMLDEAAARFDATFAPDPNAYAYLEESPYHLAVGSYLSAAGVFGNIYLLLRTHQSHLAADASVVPHREAADAG